MSDLRASASLRGLRAGDLVAAALPPGPVWPGLIASAWEAGAAVLPIDPRLPPDAAAAMRATARPTAEFDGAKLVRLRRGEPVAEAVGLVVASSGTTGTPKLAELTREALAVAVTASGRRLGATRADPWFGCLSVAHVGGMLVALRAVLLRAPVTLRPRFDPAEMGVFAAEHRGFSSLVPTLLSRLLDAGTRLEGFRGLLVGGARTSPDLVERARRHGAPIVRTYGLTETSGGVVYEGTPLAGVEVRIAEDGEILLRGRTLMRGYRLDPAATQASIDRAGWLRTGDAGRWEDGRLVIEGRLDDLIVTGGQKVWPGGVEAVLRRHPGVADAAVVGVPDREWGQRVVAFVVPARRGDPPRLEDVRRAVAERLPAFAAPRELRLVPGLPRTSSGKLRRELLGDAVL